MTITELVKKLSELPSEAEVNVTWIDDDTTNEMSTYAIGVVFEPDEGGNGNVYIGQVA